MQALENKYIYGTSTACTTAVDYDETSSVRLYPLAGLWVIYGGAVACAAIMAAVRVWHMHVYQPHKRSELQARAQLLSRQVSAVSRSSSVRSRQSAAGAPAGTPPLPCTCAL